MRRPLTVSIFLALFVSFAALAGVTIASARPTASHAATATIKIKQRSNGRYYFATPKLTVKKGTKVTWVNTTNTDHAVITPVSKYQIQDIPPGHKASLTFKSAGTFKYHCAFHPYMKAELIVKK